jgi:hypothetical protein
VSKLLELGTQVADILSEPNPQHPQTKLPSSQFLVALEIFY